MFSEVRRRVKKNGMAPGSPVYTGDKSTDSPSVTVISYNEQQFKKNVGKQFDSPVADGTQKYTTWVNIEGLHDVALIEEVAQRFKLHPLTVEDILNVGQRPKVEEFDEYIFITLKVLSWQPKTFSFTVNQLSLVLGQDYVLSFQESTMDLFSNIQMRLERSGNQRLRQQNSDYLVYRLIDSVIDRYFVVLEALGDEIELLEERIIAQPNPQNSHTLYKLKQQMLILRKSIWPMREALGHLLHIDSGFISKFTQVYLRDVYDHAMQAMDAVETFRDILSSMVDMYLSSLTMRMNEIMKILTIITTIFIPITAIASIYGMNLPNIPLMDWSWGFITVLSMMLLVAVIMIVYFRKMKWI